MRIGFPVRARELFVNLNKTNELANSLHVSKKREAWRKKCRGTILTLLAECRVKCVGTKDWTLEFKEKYFKMREGCEVQKGNVTSREIPECFLRDKDIHTGCFKEA